MYNTVVSRKRKGNFEHYSRMMEYPLLFVKLYYLFKNRYKYWYLFT